MTIKRPFSSSIADRVIRVFISSTFLDMQSERELLVKKVFPELRSLCTERFVSFTEVDLRWGITEEQAAEGKVLPICLEEIKHCLPYFICMLGERYGWIPDSVPKKVIAQESWIEEHLTGRTSVTELEIVHGVLRNPAMADHAFFYFRDPAYVSSIPETDRADYSSEDKGSKRKLQNLKERIRRSGLPVTEDYPKPEALAAAVLRQFTELIERLYPIINVPDILDRETLKHEAYAKRKLAAHVDLQAYSSALDKFVITESTGRGLVIAGESGIGKTTLLASRIKHWRQKHRDDFIFSHYFGATPESASVDGFLHRLLNELKRHYGITDDIPIKPDMLREVLPLWLAQTVGRNRVVLCLDGLDKIEGSEPDRHLRWLPRYFPPHVRVFVSALPGLALDSLEDFGWEKLILKPLGPAERRRIIKKFFRHYGKTLHPDLIRQIAAAPGSGNPLFLRTVLEELRQFGSFERLREKVAHYIRASSPKDLFRLAIQRWQEDFDGKQNLVRRTLSCLWAARQGLAEGEWLEMLQTSDHIVSRQDWRPLFLALEPHLAHRAGLYTFGHDFLRQAVKDEYLALEESRTEAHLALADYFERQPQMNTRKAAEWPWQLHAAGSWTRLESALKSLDLFLALFNDRGKWELSGYWLPLRARGIDMGQSYMQALQGWIQQVPDPETAADLRPTLGCYLLENGCYPAAGSLLRKALPIHEKLFGEDSDSTLRVVNLLAELLKDVGKYSQAEPLYLRALETRERLKGPDARETLISVNNLAGLLQKQRKYDEAEVMFRRGLEGSEAKLGPKHFETLTALNNLALLLYDKRNFARAELLYRDGLERCGRVLGSGHPLALTLQNNLALLLSEKRDFDQAQSLYQKVLASRDRLLGPDHPDTLVSVNNLGELFRITGDLIQAEPLLHRCLEGRKRVLGFNSRSKGRAAMAWGSG